MKKLIAYLETLLRQNNKTYVEWLENAQGAEQLFIRDALIAMGSD